MKLELSPKLNQEGIEKSYYHHHFDGVCTIEEYQFIYSQMEPLTRCQGFFRHVLSMKNCLLGAITLGNEIDCMQQRYQKEEEYLKAHMVDCLASDILRESYRLFGESINSMTGYYIASFIFAGDQDTTLETVGEILESLNISEIKYNQCYGMKPRNTVVFKAKLTECQKDKSSNICNNCNHLKCIQNPHRSKRDLK
jgi:hypothetical protein